MITVRYLETVLLRQVSVLLITARLGKRLSSFLVEDITDPLQEQQREHICLEVRCIDGTAKNVRSFPKHRLQIQFSTRHHGLFLAAVT